MLTVSGLTKSFNTPEGRNTVIKGIDFTVKEGDCYALLGPSGCGKTTTLRCVAGLEQADAEVITIGGQLVSDPAAVFSFPCTKGRLASCSSLMRSGRILMCSRTSPIRFASIVRV